jgi:hypothetical protein
MPPRKGNYLSRLMIEDEKARDAPRGCYFMARACFTSRGVRGARELLVEVLDISETGVRLFCKRPHLLPAHFYLCIGHYQHAIGCATTDRNGELIWCDFLRAQSQQLVDYLASVPSPQSTLSAIRHPLFGHA